MKRLEKLQNDIHRDSLIVIISTLFLIIGIFYVKSLIEKDRLIWEKWANIDSSQIELILLLPDERTSVNETISKPLAINGRDIIHNIINAIPAKGEDISEYHWGNANWIILIAKSDENDFVFNLSFDHKRSIIQYHMAKNKNNCYYPIGSSRRSSSLYSLIDTIINSTEDVFWIKKEG